MIDAHLPLAGSRAGFAVSGPTADRQQSGRGGWRDEEQQLIRRGPRAVSPATVACLSSIWRGTTLLRGPLGPDCLYLSSTEPGH